MHTFLCMNYLHTCNTTEKKKPVQILKLPCISLICIPQMTNEKTYYYMKSYEKYYYKC